MEFKEMELSYEEEIYEIVEKQIFDDIVGSSFKIDNMVLTLTKLGPPIESQEVLFSFSFNSN